MFQIQIFGYNSDLYTNFSEAMHKSHGIVGISILLQVFLFEYLVNVIQLTDNY